MALYVLVATIPARKNFCERLLIELSKQSRKPDGVILCLDGYGENPTPKCPLDVKEILRTEVLSGAGQRWRAYRSVGPDDVMINVDDDHMLFQAPRMLELLAAAVENGDCAAAAMGRTAKGRGALPLGSSRGQLVYAAACGLAFKARHLEGHDVLAKKVVGQGGPDTLGIGGDDDALLSAHFFLTDVKIVHVPVGNIFPAPGTRDSSQTVARQKRGETPHAQKLALKKITGWPWPVI